MRYNVRHKIHLYHGVKMAYQKKYATEEERRKAKSEAGKKGAARRIALGHNKGGRPKGASNKDPSTSEPVHSIQVRESAYKVFAKLAGVAGVTLVGFMSKVAESLKAKNLKHFTDEPPVKI